MWNEEANQSGGAPTKKCKFLLVVAAAVGLVPSVSTLAIAEGGFEHDVVS
jgi:hypothetical protein